VSDRGDAVRDSLSVSNMEFEITNLCGPPAMPGTAPDRIALRWPVHRTGSRAKATARRGRQRRLLITSDRHAGLRVDGTAIATVSHRDLLTSMTATLQEFSPNSPGECDMMFKSSLLVSAILAAGAAACHHDRPTATPATSETTSSGMTATAEPGKTGDPSNSYNTNNSYNSNATSPGATVPGDPALPMINDPDRTGSPRTPSGSGAPSGNGTDTGRDKGVNGNEPDTTTPTMTKDSGSGSNTGTGSGSNTTRRNRTGATSGAGSRSSPNAGAKSGSNGNGSADGSAGSGSDVPQ
jgi:hypothetical protein